MQIKATASGGGVYIVTVNGVELSRHSTLHKAMEAATNAELANPSDDIEITQALSIKVEAVQTTPAPTPPPDPTTSFDGAWGDSWVESWGAV